MPRGGARNRSGPQKDPKSARSEKLGVRFGRLPRTGYSGRPPAWPLTSKATPAERKVWLEAWKTPQAAAWATEPWRWRSVAQWVRLTVRVDEHDSPAAIVTAAIRLADQIGLTPAGLRENGWEIEEAPASRVAAEAAEQAAKAPKAPPISTSSPRERLTVVSGGR